MLDQSTNLRLFFRANKLGLGKLHGDKEAAKSFQYPNGKECSDTFFIISQKLGSCIATNWKRLREMETALYFITAAKLKLTVP